MKKVWFVVLFFFSLVLLAGCQEVEPSEPVVSHPETEVPTVIVEEGTFVVEVRNLAGDILLSESVVYDEDSEMSIAELIDEQIGMDYTVHPEYGWFVQGVGNIYPTEFNVTYNYWFSLLVNGEMSFVGIENIEYEEGLTVTFKESSMLDQEDLKVDRLIYEFLDKHLATYMNEHVTHYGVFAALKQLKTRGYHTIELTANLEVADQTIGDLYKKTILQMVLEVDTDATKALLESKATTNVYEAISLLYGLTMVGGNAQMIEDLVNLIITTENTYMDADYAGMTLAVLSYYQDIEGVEAFINQMLDYILTTLSDTGVTSWGQANASSTAQVILGLVALGINPRGEVYTTEGMDLIEALLLYSLEGAFRYQLTQSEADMSFSTPQAFQALVAYKIYRDTWGNPPVELHNLGA